MVNDNASIYWSIHDFLCTPYLPANILGWLDRHMHKIRVNNENNPWLLTFTSSRPSTAWPQATVWASSQSLPFMLSKICWPGATQWSFTFLPGFFSYCSNLSSISAFLFLCETNSIIHQAQSQVSPCFYSFQICMPFICLALYIHIDLKD